MKTGIFYHPSFSRRSYLTQGSRLQDFPKVLEPLLTQPRFALYESPPIADEWLLKVHTQALLDEVALDPLCATAWHSVGGVVLAAEMIATDLIHNAFAFIGAGGHHAGRDFFGGYCCFNDVVIAITKLRQVHGIQRFAILDTDAHHADGTRALVRSDPDVLHVCVCGLNQCSADSTKVDIGPASGGCDGSAWLRPGLPMAADRDQIYAQTALNGFLPRAKSFHPEFMFWYFGFDTHQGDYGDLGLSRGAYLGIAAALKELAEDLCDGRLEVVLGGGSRSDIARELIPPVIEILGR